MGVDRPALPIGEAGVEPASRSPPHDTRAEALPAASSRKALSVRRIGARETSWRPVLARTGLGAGSNSGGALDSFAVQNDPQIPKGDGRQDLPGRVHAVPAEAAVRGRPGPRSEAPPIGTELLIEYRDHEPSGGGYEGVGEGPE
jgi:hypothetical protein